MACVSTFPGLDKSALAEDFSSRWWFLKDYEKNQNINRILEQRNCSRLRGFL